MANNGFSINVGTILDTSNVPKDLEKIQAKLVKAIDIPIRIKDVDAKSGSEVWSKAVKSLRTYKDELGNTYQTIVKLNQAGENFVHIDGTVEQEKLRKVAEGARELTTEVHKWTDSKGAIQTWTTSIDSAGNKITTRVKESVTALGEITTETSKWGQKTIEVNGKLKTVYGQIGDTIKNVKEFTTEMTTTTSSRMGQIVDTVNGVQKSYQGLITTTEKVGTNGEYLRTVVSKYTDDLGRVIEKTEQFNKANQQVATTLRKVGDAPKLQSTAKETLINKNGVKSVIEYTNGIATLRTVTKEYTNNLGQLTKETRVYDEQTHKLIKVHRELINNQKEQKRLAEEQKRLKQQLLTTQQQEEQIIVKNGVAVKALVTTTKEQSHEYGEITTKITQYTDTLGRTVVETEKFDANNKALAQSTKVVTQEINKSESATRNLGQAQDVAATKSKTLGQSLSGAFTQLARFYIASLPIRLFTQTISETISIVKDFDAAITEMGKVTDYSGEQLRKYTEDLGKLGAEVARTRTEMTEAATGWLKAGYSEEDAAKLAKYSSLLQNTADEELSAADATSILVSQLKAYHMEADEAIKVTDIINKVSAEQAVSSGDIAKGLQQASSSMATFGNSIEQTTALLTGGTTIFQGQSQRVARALNTIAIRVTKNKDELAKYGIVVENTDGSLRSTYDILTDLKPKWDAMTDAERTALGATLAGTNQYRILAAVMSQMDVVQETYTQALNASGTTMKQNEVYMSSLEAKTTAFKAQLETLVIGKGGLQSMAKIFVDLGTGALKLINDIGGLKTIFVALAGVILTLKIETLITSFKNFGTAIVGLGTKLIKLATLLREGGTAGVSLNAQLKDIGINATATQLAIGALTAALTIGVAIWGLYQSHIEKTKAELEQSQQAYEQYTSSLNETIQKIQDENTSKEELLKINKDLHGSYDSEKQDLVDLKDLRQENIDLLYEEAKAKAETYLREHGSEKYDAEKFFANSLGSSSAFSKDKTLGTLSSLFDASGFIDDVKEKLEEIYALKPEDAVDELNKRIDNLNNTIDDLNYKEKTNGKLTSEESLERSHATVLLKNYEKVLTKANDEIEKQNHNIELLNESEKNANQTKEEWIDKNNKIESSNKKIVGSTDELIKKYGLQDEAILNLMEDQELTFEEAVQLLAQEKVAAYGTVEAYEELSKSTSSLVSEINDLATALNEQEKNGSIALETQLKLIESGYAMALSYDEETGACKLDEEATQKLVEAKIQAQIENLNYAKSSIIETLRQEGQQAVSTASAYLELAKTKSLASQSYFTNGKNGGRDISDPSLSTSGYGGNYGYIKMDTSAAQKQIQALDKQIEALEHSLTQVQKGGVKSFNSVGKAATGAGKSAKSAGKDMEDAAKDAKKALEDLKSKYEKAIKYIEKLYDKKIDAIKKDKEAALDSIEKQIKALEKQKDATLDSIEAQIKALKNAKDARKKYWDEQIDALKKANKEQKDAIELQEKLDALEKARKTKVKVYKEGQGFVYDVDQTAVAEAQKALDEYLSEKAYEEELQRLEDLRDAELENYEQRIDALEDYKDRVQENYEKQIENLKEYKEAISEQYDEQIEMYENYKQQFEDMVNAYEDEQSRLLVQQLTGINLENDNWMTRLDNLRNFVDQYHNLLRQLEDVNSTPTVTNTGTTVNTSAYSGGGNNNYNSGYTKVTPYTPPYKTNKNYTDQGGSGSKDGSAGLQLSALESRRKKVLGYADGIDSVKEDEIAIVGENPNREIVIGSKINNGDLMQLDKGTGVVNANSSKTFAGMLNEIGRYGSSGFGSGNGSLSNITNDSLTINGVTIEGSNIKDPQTFVNGLLNLKAEALQRAYKHS